MNLHWWEREIDREEFVAGLLLRGFKGKPVDWMYDRVGADTTIRVVLADDSASHQHPIIHIKIRMPFELAFDIDRHEELYTPALHRIDELIEATRNPGITEIKT